MKMDFIAQAWAENGVICRDDGRTVGVHPRCPYCGTVNMLSIMNGSCPPNTWRMGLGVAFCSNHQCRKSFQVAVC